MRHTDTIQQSHKRVGLLDAAPCDRYNKVSSQKVSNPDQLLSFKNTSQDVRGQSDTFT